VNDFDFNFFLAGAWKMDWEPRDKEMDEKRSSHRLARIQHHLRPGLPLCSPGQLEFMATLGIGQPALELATAFPQATPASIFPPAVSDYYQLDGLLSPEDVALRERVRDVMETHVAPVMTKYWEKAEFPFEVVPKLASLMVAGGTVKVCTLNYLVPRMYLGLSSTLDMKVQKKSSDH
jgi:hypothetical protein